MPIFINSTEYVGQDSGLVAAILNISPSTISTTKSEIDTDHVIQVFPRQAVLLDSTSIYKLDNSTIDKQINFIYVKDFHLGFMLHIRSNDTISYTAYIDPYTTIDWKTVIEYLSNQKIETDKLRLEIALGYINSNKNNVEWRFIVQLINDFFHPLFNYLKDSKVEVNFSTIYCLSDSKLLDHTNSANILVDISNGSMTVCSQKNNAYYPINMFPIERSLMHIRNFDYGKTDEVILIYNRNRPIYTRLNFEKYWSQLSIGFEQTLSNYKQVTNFDLSHIVDYLKRCLCYKLKNYADAEELFTINLLFYMNNASSIFTSIKFFPEIANRISVAPNKSPSSKRVRMRSSSDGEITPLTNNDKRPDKQVRKLNEDTLKGSPLLMWSKPSTDKPADTSSSISNALPTSEMHQKSS
jgi:hypothetical protein